MSVRLLQGIALLVVWTEASGCSLMSLLRENTRTVQASTAGIAANTEMVRQSSRITETLLPAMQGLSGLEGPMEAVVGLRPTLESVAALDQPMVRLSALDTSMGNLANLEGPMVRLSQLGPSLEATAALREPMERVADMRPSLEATAALRESLDRVAALRPELAQVGNLASSMDQLSTLREPMTRLAGLAPPGGSRWSWLLVAVGALAAWGAVTFVAIRLAIVSALRAVPSSAQALAGPRSPRQDGGD